MHGLLSALRLPQQQRPARPWCARRGGTLDAVEATVRQAADGDPGGGGL